jgi:hypothetical protein
MLSIILPFKNVSVEERTDGTMRKVHNGRRLRYLEIFARPFRTKKSAERPKSLTTWKPSDSHTGKSPAMAMIKARTELQAAS